MKHSDIVVIIPMYNSKDTILRALNSIDAQTIIPNRVVVVDDGSVDESVSIVKDYAKNSKLLINVLLQPNSGPAAARNKGITYSTENLICFLDSDDEWCNTKLEEQLCLYNKLTDEGRNVGLIDCFMVDIKGDKEVEQHNFVLKGNHFKDFLTMNVVKGTPCVMVRKDVVEECGGFDEELKFAEDRLLWSKISHRYEMHTVTKVLVKRYFGNEGNITFYPEKNYVHKMLFVEKFLNEFSCYLDSEQKIKFRLSNIYDFLTVFYANKNYNWVKVSYKDMMSVSLKSFYYNNYFATLKFIASCVKDKRKSDV
ncbi:glycosyltransferase family 2 protein [Motilimonas cestriensis]|uniref:Glycosyltransferase family 2 protein n=1 Tax=Motilimonas cestriensis TaxID=2742685 RepID=A0ABS8W6W5_9GAMM|nr:glycosyltransferase family 2 protein [Motilimonas cestriensis]